MKSFKEYINNIDEAAGWLNKAVGGSTGTKEDPAKGLSDTAKKVIEKTKTDAGDSWDSISEKYTKVIGLIDKGVQSMKNTYTDASKILGAPVENIEAKIGDFVMSVLGANKNVSKTVQGWVDDTSDKGAQSMSVFALFCVGVMSASKAALKPQDITDAITAMAADGQ